MVTKIVPESEVVGGRVVSVEVWGPITVEKDGDLFEIVTVNGHQGPEHEIRRVKVSAPVPDPHGL